MTTSLDAAHPWPGPDSFLPEDAAFFRGRDTEIRQLLQLIRRARSVVLYGASGLGKTSLLNAGIIPQLDAAELFAVPVRINYDSGAPSASEQIQTEILRGRSGPGMPSRRPGCTAWELLHLRDEPIEGAQPLLIFDQFEELFTIGVGTVQAAELLEELKGLIEGIPPQSLRERLERFPAQARGLSFQRNNHRVLISIREDFLHGLESLREHLPSIIHNRFRIGPLSGAMAMEVVMQSPRPASDQSAPEALAARTPIVGRDVAELIVRTVASSDPDDRPLEELEVEPALLSILCAELARRRSAGAPITQDLVTGSRADIISTFYERALHDVPAEVRTYVEDVLVTATGFRTSAVVAEAMAAPGFTSDVLDKLVKRRLVRVIDRPNGKWLELTHDILTKIAAQSRAERQERLRAELEHKAREEQQRAEQGARAARERKLRRRVLVSMLAVLVVFVGLGWYSREQNSRRGAADEARRAMRQQLIDTSLRSGRYRDALVQLAAVVREDPAAAWARSLIGDLLRRRNWPQPLPPLFPDGPFTDLTCNFTGTRCAAAFRDGRVFVRGDLSLDLRTGHTGFASLFMSDDGSRLIFVPQRPGSAIAWTFSPAGITQLPFPIETSWNTWSASSDARVVVLPVDDKLAVWRLGVTAERSEVERSLGIAAFALSYDGRWLAYADRTNTQEPVVVLRDLNTGTNPRPLGTKSAPSQMTFTRDSKVLAAALDGGSILRWQLPDSRRLETLSVKGAIHDLWFSNMGDRLVASVQGGTVALWMGRQKQPHEVTRLTASVMRLSFAPDDRRFVVSTDDGLVGSWDSDGRALGEPVRHDGPAFVAPLHDGSLVSLSLSGTSARWRVPRPLGKPVEFSLGEPVLHAWFFSEDGLFAHGRSRWLEQSGGGRRSGRFEDGIRSFSADRHYVAEMYADRLVLKQTSPADGKPTDPGESLVEVMIDDASFTVDGRRLVAAGGNKGYFFEVPSRKMIGSPVDDVDGAWVSPDGTLVAVQGPDTGVTLWRWGADGQLSKLVDVPALTVSHLAFAPRNESLVIVSANRAQVWSVRERSYIGIGVTHDGPILDAQFSPDGRWVVSASQDGLARIWDAATGLPAADSFQLGQGVAAASFSPSGRRLLTAGIDGSVRVWELSGAEDAGDLERIWLARLAEILSGLQINPATMRPVPAVHAHEALQVLRGEVARKCPGMAGQPPLCASRTGVLVRTLLGLAAE